MEVLLRNRQHRLPAASRVLKAIARRVIQRDRSDVDEVSIVLGDDTLLEELNTSYRSRPRPTDVLSFPLDDEGPYRVLGEVVISSDRVVAQAAEYGHSAAEEMTRLLVHGLLHLLGDEHDTASGARRMRAREREWRSQLDPWVVKLHTAYSRAS